MRHLRPWRNLILAATLCLPLAVQAAATFQLVNLDGPGEGFNDATPFVAVGGNTATTLGQARLNAFQYAANILGGLVTSSVTIRVEINMDPLGGSASSATLGFAGPNVALRDFSGAPVANTWYVEALANKLAGGDLSPGTNDISATFNSDVDNGTVLGSTNWYYGLDGNTGGHIDFVSVVLHELVHGLGFLDLVDLGTGAKAGGFDDAYMRHLEHHGASPADYPSMSNAQRVTASTSVTNLHWTGPAVTAASGSLSAGVSGGHVQMYAPNPQTGGSVSHFSTALSPNELMEPSYTGPIHTLGLAAQLLTDIGWSGGAPPPPPNSPPNTPTSPSPADTASGVSVNPSLSWTGGDPDVGNTVTYDVYFGTSGSPPQVTINQPTTVYSPSTLVNNTTYYWKIVARDNLSATTSGPVWSFTTAAAAPPPPNSSPNIPTNPSPGDNASGMGVSTNLFWTGGDPDAGNTVTYDVYFGTSASPPQVTTNQSATFYSPGALANSTTYFWKIVARDNFNATATGPVWSFTTAAAAPPPPPPPNSMALPTGPTQFSCVDGAGGVFNSTDPAAARPLGAVNAGGQLAVQLGSVAFAAPVDVYVVAQLPSSQQLIMNSLKQWLPFPVNTVPYRTGTSSALSFDTLWQALLASIPPGAYAAYTVIVPAGTNPATFNLASSSYYLWCTTRTLP